MKKYSLCTIFCLFFMLFSCVKETSETDFFSGKIKDLHINDNIKYVIVLPGLGCKGCIQEGELFMKKNIGNNRIFFVLTKIESLKLLQQKTGINMKKYSNIYIDNNDLFNLPTKQAVYPCIIQMSNRQIDSVTFQSPQNSSAFLKLEYQISHL